MPHGNAVFSAHPCCLCPRDPRRITAQTLLTELIADVRSISDVSSQPAKYAELLERFDGYPLDRLIEVIYPGPESHPLTDFDGPYRSITFSELEGIEIDDYAGEWGIFKELVPPLFAP